MNQQLQIIKSDAEKSEWWKIFIYKVTIFIVQRFFNCKLFLGKTFVDNFYYYKNTNFLLESSLF